MKNSSICWGSILISCFLLCGCTSSKSDTTTCSINGQGLQDEQIITSVDGNVTVLEERLEIDLLDLGASKENIETIDEEDLRALFESQIPQLADTIEGVQVDYQLEDEKAILRAISELKQIPKPCRIWGSLMRILRIYVWMDRSKPWKNKDILVNKLIF